jgi:predicted transglutaminase-like protease
LQQSGTTNMFNAPRYLKKEFGLDKKNSILIFKEWVKDAEKKHQDFLTRMHVS